MPSALVAEVRDPAFKQLNVHALTVSAFAGVDSAVLPQSETGGRAR
jgi:hypothetical protein